MAPPTPETITAGWLTERLRAAGYERTTVLGFRAERIGTGQIGKCVRYHLELAGDDPGAPRTLVGKFPSDDPTSRATGVMLGNFLKEVSFYQQLQHRVSIATPRCYHAEIEGAGPEFALLLEDLAPACPGDQLRGCSPAVAEAAVLELVGLHAPSWCDAGMAELDWVGAPDAARAAVRELYRANLPGFLDRYGGDLAPDERRVIERLGSARALWEGVPDPFCLVHVDYRLDNLLVDSRGPTPRVTVVDWQSITIGPPLRDVAYFLGAGLLPEDRRRHEAAIVAAYHDALGRAGVEGYDRDRCWEDYRRGTFGGFGVTVIASMLVERTARGDEMFTVMARRHARHALDLGADGLLD